MANEGTLYSSHQIRTHSGKWVNVFEPTADMFVIEDISHALSRQCRFAGHLEHHYSVAQHSIMCSYLVPQEYALQALMHDASEAYLVDIPSPIKRHLSNYKEIEDKVMKCIADKFGFNFPFDEPIKKADVEMLEFEWSYLMLKEKSDKIDLTKNKLLNRDTDYTFYCWCFEEAKQNFIQRYKQLTEQ